MSNSPLSIKLLAAILSVLVLGNTFAESATIYVPDDYATIQGAVNAADPGDSIIVKPGIYTENVKINKDNLIIKAESGAEVTIVQGASYNTHVFEVIADYVSVSGFTVKKTSVGIYLDGVSECRISNNIISNNGDGIRILNSDENIITENKIDNNGFSIYLEGSHNNDIDNNLFNADFVKMGFYIGGSHLNRIKNNIFANDGLIVYGAYYNMVENNTVNGKPLIYLEDVSDFTISGIDVGQVILINCSNVLVRDLVISNTTVAVELYGTSNSRIMNNVMSGNLYGIYLWSSNGNDITNNDANSNYYHGISLYFCNNNQIYLNNYRESIYRRNVDSSVSANVWNSPEKITYTYNDETDTNYLGNYWDDYTGTDGDGDGIGYPPYDIDSDQDNYPLMTPFENYGFGADEHWVKVANTPLGIWSLRKEPGTQKEVLMIVPNEWVFKRVGESSQTIDGYIWRNVENPGNGITGWMAAETEDGQTQYLVPGDQEKAEELGDFDARAIQILRTIDHYYNSIEDTDPISYKETSLYKSNDWGTINSGRQRNHLTYLRENTFPIELILAIAASESGWPGIYDFDNEIYDQTYADAGKLVEAGVGIMQIHGLANRGWGSNLKCYAPGCSEAFYEEGLYKHKYYTNTKQGIYANIKDGMRVLQYKLWQSLQYNAGKPKAIQWAGAIWRYRGEKPDYPGYDYLAKVAQNFELLETTYFGDYKIIIPVNDWIVGTERVDMLDKFLNYEIGEIQSPGELRVRDSEGRVTGMVNGDVYTEIPYSDYNDEAFLVLAPHNIDVYEVVGTMSDSYGLVLNKIENGKLAHFTALTIPVLAGSIHQYMVDWIAISQGLEGVTVNIDADGDGFFERTVIADEDLTSEEFALQTETVIDFDPDVLNIRSPGKLVTVYIELPEGFEVGDIVVSTLKLNNIVPALSKPIAIGDYDEDGIADLMVKFDRQQVLELFGSGTQMVTLTGRLSDGRPIAGTDFIRVIGGESIETVESEFEWIAPADFTTDVEKNLQPTNDGSINTSEEDTFDVRKAIGFMLFDAEEIIGELGPDSFYNEESSFELKCAIDEVFTMLDEGMYYEALVILEGDILERMDGCANIGQPGEDDWITSIKGQALFYPLVVETIELLESML